MFRAGSVFLHRAGLRDISGKFAARFPYGEREPELLSDFFDDVLLRYFRIVKGYIKRANGQYPASAPELKDSQYAKDEMLLF